MNKYKYLLKNTILFTLGNMSSKLITFLFLPLYTYYLTTEQYASIDLITVINRLIVPILSCSIYEAVLRFALDREEDKRKVFTIGLKFIFIGSLITLFLLPILNTIETLGSYKIYFFLLFVTTALNSLFSVFARSIDKVKLITINSIVSSVIIAILNILLIAIFKLEVNGYFIALISGNIITNLVYFFKGKMYQYLDFEKNDTELVKRMLKYSLPLIPNSLFWWINSSLDRFFLTYMTSMSIVGLYSAASKLPAVLNTLNGIFQQAWGISAIKEYESDDRTQFFSQMYRIYNLFILTCSAILILLCKYLGIFLFKNDFYNAWIIVPALTIGFFYSCLNSFLGSIFTATKSTKLLLTTTLTGAIINVGMNLVLIPKWGAIGAAVGTVISHFAVWMSRLYRGNKIVKLDIDYKKMLFSHICIIAMAILVTINNIYMEICALIIFIIVLIVNKEDEKNICMKFVHLITKRRGKENEGNVKKN